MRNGSNFRVCLPLASPLGRTHLSRVNEVAVAQQIDYVPVEGFPGGCLASTLLTHATHVVIPPMLLSPLQKLQRVSSRSAKHSIIKSTPVLPYAVRKGPDTRRGPTLRFNWRRSHRNGGDRRTTPIRCRERLA